MSKLIKYYYGKWKLICIQLVIFLVMWGISALYEWQGSTFTGFFKEYQVMLSASFAVVVWEYNEWKCDGCNAFFKIKNRVRSVCLYLLPILIELAIVFGVVPSHKIFNAFLGSIAYTVLAAAIFYATLVFTEERMALFLSLAFVFCEWLFFGIDREVFDILSLFADNKYQYPQDLGFWFGKCILIGVLLYCCTLGKQKISVFRSNSDSISADTGNL